MVGMKLISLNCYGGRFFESLMEFIQTHAQDTDIFCLQEIFNSSELLVSDKNIRTNLFQELEHALPEFQGIFFETRDQSIIDLGGSPVEVLSGKATFIKKQIHVESSEHVFVHGSRETYVPDDVFSKPCSLGCTTILAGAARLVVCNFHGIPFPGEKLDTPERIVQSQKILDFVNAQSAEKIICGDFNLKPETESIHMIREKNFSELVIENKITTTRGTLCKKINPQYAHTPEGYQEYADYCFVSPGIKVKKFEVPDVPVSDHLPMIVKFEV